MQDSESQDDRVNVTAALTRRQVEALRLAALEEDRSVSSYLRKVVDRWFGFDKTTLDPLANEQEKVA